MENIQIAIEGKTLMICIDLAKRLGPSKSGKSELIATTSGNLRLETLIEKIPNIDDVAGIVFGLNCYIGKET